MALRSLNQLRFVRSVLTGLRRHWLRWTTGAIVHPSASISLSSKLKAGRHGGIVVGPETLIAFKTLIDARDFVSGEIRPISIGQRCFIGGGSMIMPGVTVGDEVIVGAGAVVTHDVPSQCIVAGVPARVIRSGIVVGRFGRLTEIAEANAQRRARTQLQAATAAS